MAKQDPKIARTRGAITRAEKESLAKTGAAALATLPEDLQLAAGQGAENLNPNDIKPPRLCLAQAMSPQVKRSDPKHIPGLAEGDLYNDLTGEIYGEEQMEIIVVQCLGNRFIEFAPMDEGGGIIDRNVHPDDPRAQFTTDPENPKVRIKPVATEFYDFLVWLPKQQELMSLSMKGTQLKVAKTLNSLCVYPLKIEGVLVPTPPVWARIFSLGTATESDANYSWANFTLNVKGTTNTETRIMCMTLFNQYKAKNVVIDVDAPVDATASDAADL